MKLQHFFALIMLTVVTCAQAQPKVDVGRMIIAAKPGVTVRLPAGTFKVATVAVPPGVKLVGAGYDKTILDVTGSDDGLVVSGMGAVVSDLTLKGAGRTALKVHNASNITVSRVQLLDSLTGLIADNASNSRFENLIASGNRTGAVLSNCTRTTLVNSTLTGNASLGLSLARLQNCAVFNNLIANSPTGVYLGGDHKELALDHNLYVASFIGKKEGEVARKTVQSWRDISGMDAHSVSLPIAYAANSFRPVSPLSWAPTRATTSDWGVSELAGFKAPAQDIAGQKRTLAPDAGAYEVTLPAPRPADGSFQVQSQGVTSAGLYTKAGVNVAYLFQNLPLAAGTHQYWLPSRDFMGRPIAAGDYQLRVVESDLDLEYVGLSFNKGKSNRVEDHSSFTAQEVAFDNKGRLILVQNWSENHLNVRAFDAEFEGARWSLPGSSNTNGVAVDGGYFYSLRQYDKNLLGLVKLDSETGAIQEVGDGKYALTFPGVFTDAADGMTALNKVLYVADPSQNKLFYAPVINPTFQQSFSIPSPSDPAADSKNNLIWLISEKQKVLAYSPDGKLQHELQAPSHPVAISVNNGRLAVASAHTGKVHIFDITNPAQPKLVLAVGRGDSPYNPFLPDRFLFKEENGVVPSRKVDVALNSQGELAVIDDFRVLFFDAAGKIKRDHISVWGQHLTSGKFAGDETPRFFSMRGNYAMTLDTKTRTWKPDGFYYVPPGLDGRAPLGYFSHGGQNFGVFRQIVNTLADGSVVYGAYRGTQKIVKRPTRLVVLRFDGYIGRMVQAFHHDGHALLRQSDSNNDGALDDKDTMEPMVDGGGNPLTYQIMGDPRFMTLLPDGSLRISLAVGAAGGGFVIPMRGVEKGVPIYDWANRRLLPMEAEKDGTLTSPYDFKTVERINARIPDLDFFPDGGYAATVGLKTSGGTGLANNFGTDVAGFSAEGKMQWLHPLAWAGGVGGVQIVNDVVLTNRGTELEFIALSRDGLGLGVLGPKEEARWSGWWIDHPEQFRAFIGNDGKPHVLIGDYALNAFHWYVLNGTDKLRRTVLPVSINATKAAQLTALEAQPPARPVQPPATTVSIPKLNTPLAIDGDLSKWRNLGIAPKILVTPEAASADIKGPQDKSAVIRLAHEGGNLYVQIIAFDDVVTMHQPLKLHYKQDSTEMAINGFMTGFKFSVTRTQEHGETLLRERFVKHDLTQVLSPQQAPRVIRVLEDAQDVEERTLIESIYGVNLSQSKVIVTEFKLPLEAAFAGDPKSGPASESGATFWLGFMVDDNDVPGSDLQKLLIWPATYNTFAPKEAGALATLE